MVDAPGRKPRRVATGLMSLPIETTPVRRRLRLSGAQGGAARAPEVLSRAQRDILTLQRASGNSAVARLLQRSAPTIQRQTAAPAEVVTNDTPTIDNWPTSLPKAVRATNTKDRSKDENLHVQLGTRVKKEPDTVVGPYDKVVKEKVWPKGGGKPYEQEYVIRAPTLENADKGLLGQLTEGQRAFVQSIAAARDAMDIGKLHLNRYQGKFGWQYGGKPGKDATPTAVQGSADTSTVEGKRKQAEQWIWEELRFEGSSASINAYDSQMVTWGRGLGAASGPLNVAMAELFKDPEIVRAFQSVGVSFQGSNTWLAINTVTGAVEQGTNALAIMQTDPHILAAMIEIGENERFKQEVADAQWKGIKAHGTANVPDFALDWPKAIIQLVAHITHWAPAYGWHSQSSGYAASGGDALAVVLHFFRVTAGKANKNGSFSIRKMGPDTVSNFKHWGGGVGFQTIEQNFQALDLSKSDVEDNTAYNGAYILKRGEADKSGNMPCYVRGGQASPHGETVTGTPASGESIP